MQQSLFGSLITATPASTEMIHTGSRLNDAVYTVIDLETTGLNAKKSAITEVTAIQYANGQELGMYSTLVKPDVSISEEVRSITGISDDMVQNAPALITVLSDLCAFVGPAPIIVGHNVGFDIKFLREKLFEVGLASFTERFDFNRAICTKLLAQKTIPGLPSYEGIMVASHCDVHNPNPHRAESDVRMAAGILFYMLQSIPAANPDICTVTDLLAFQGVVG